jgi:glycosyltransferase involved in cell wall biosynthesis
MLSLVIPAYNEQDRIGLTLDYLATEVQRLEDAEVIVVDDGSVDRTAAVVADRASRWSSIRLIRHERNRGKGAAVQAGVLVARGDIICFSDADLPVPLEVIQQMARRARRGEDVVIASRGGSVGGACARRGLSRRLISWVFNRVVQRLFRLPFIDTQCGVKCFRREAARMIFTQARIAGFVFDVEVLLLAQRLGYRVGQIGVHINHAGLTTVRLLPHAVEVFRDLWRLRQRYGARGSQ